MAPYAILITSLLRVGSYVFESQLDLPSITTVNLPRAFKYRDNVTIVGSAPSSSTSSLDIGTLGVISRR